jgi:phosphatidate cytidylyltransferase
MLGGILWNAASFFILFLVIAILAMQEYFQLIREIAPAYKNTSSLHRICLILFIPAGFLIASGSHFSFLHVPAFFIGAWLALLLLIILFLEKIRNKAWIKNLRLSLLALLYIVLPFSLMIHLRWNFSINGLAIVPLGIIFRLWINDTMAYITGSLIGKTKFFPAISPKKTWEGTLGGIFLTVAAGLLYGFLGHAFYPGAWIAIAAISAIAGTAGDLLESKLKRLAEVKDSGNLMPGHGGILDRFDSLIAATPFVWLFAVIFLS